MTAPTDSAAAGPRVHELKTWPQYFHAILTGAKTFEVRRNDRGFTEGDELLLRKWVPFFDGGQVGYYTDEQLRAKVRYVYRGIDDEIADGYVVLGLADVTFERRSPRDAFDPARWEATGRPEVTVEHHEPGYLLPFRWRYEQSWDRWVWASDPSHPHGGPVGTHALLRSGTWYLVDGSES